MTVVDLTLTTADCEWPSDDLEVPHYAESEIVQVLASGTLTADHCLFLHMQGTSWQIQVNSQEKHQ